MENNVKNNVYVCITESLQYTVELTQYCILTILQLKDGKKLWAKQTLFRKVFKISMLPFIFIVLTREDGC